MKKFDPTLNTVFTDDNGDRASQLIVTSGSGSLGQVVSIGIQTLDGELTGGVRGDFGDGVGFAGLSHAISICIITFVVFQAELTV